MSHHGIGTNHKPAAAAVVESKAVIPTVPRHLHEHSLRWYSEGAAACRNQASGEASIQRVLEGEAFVAYQRSPVSREGMCECLRARPGSSKRFHRSQKQLWVQPSAPAAQRNKGNEGKEAVVLGCGAPKSINCRDCLT